MNKELKYSIYKNLSNQALGKAIAQIKTIAMPSDIDKLQNIETTYHNLLYYMFDGIEDPERNNIYNKLIKDTYQLCDNIFADKTINAYCNNQIFSKYFFASKFDNDFLNLSQELNNNGDMIDTSLAVSASTINCLENFDEAKIILLINFCNNQHTETSLRALTGLILCLITYKDRLKFYPNINNKLTLLFDNDYFIKQTQIIVKQLIRSKETERITKDIKENIIPSISKLAPKLNDKLNEKNPFDSENFEDKQNALQDIFDDAGISDKMQKYSELQLDGSDINMSTFSQLKSFSFFTNIENWFMPFYLENASIANIFSNNNEDSQSGFINFLTNNHLLCNSDKYSFCFNLQQVPEAYRNAAIEQLKMGDEQLKDIAKKTDENISNSYIQDIYRFYKLYSNRAEFNDIFNYEFDIHNTTLYRFIDFDNSFLTELSDFYFKKEQFNNALSAYQILLKDSYEPNAELYRKIGLCFQKQNNYSNAIDNYEKAILIEGDTLWLICQIAYCYKKIGNYQKALEYYKKASELQDDDISIIFNTAYCLTETGDFQTALNHFYKIDYMHPDAKKSSKFYLYLAHCLWASNDKKKAIEYYQLFKPKDQLEGELVNSKLDISAQEINFIIDYIASK